MKVDKNLRDRFRDHQYFADCVDFCEKWDEKSFDPEYQSLSPEEFAPLVQNVIARRPYSLSGQTECPMSSAKAALGAYDFQEWKKNNNVTE